MAVSGTLAVRVHRLEASFGEDRGKEASYGIQLAVGDNVHKTRFAPVGSDNVIEIDESLHYDVQATAESEEVMIEVLQQDQATPLVSAKRKLREFIGDFQESTMTFTFGPMSAANTMTLVFSAHWTPAKKSSTKVVAAAETHRPWFMRASYYYETTKNVYDYTTSFSVVSPFARLGEATVNTVLATVSGKTLYDVDQSLVVPVLDSMDNKVDATISVAFTKLYEGQQLAVRTKDKAVRAVSNAAHKTGSTVVGAANYTTHKLASATGAVYGTVTGVADYASSQVVHASSSTYGAVRGVTYSVARHIPILGPKIRA
ncbi:hypothetical protein PR003_g13388 [Phytophthora rubi]|uniref:Uncharacterized protein n=1 Tax=Phytophthora rubi TaxID=129364 RepID=A0A6A3M8Q6_9STRA|nr:hypothetical protein PR002_g13027 [Phytophthora rubi]KAE9027926.1 hypothetical protein PR001_g11858 [Phytophthora rubi]KAE9334723.1 hypothetical protein PR003_g13388 [Phytophthora rubi]